MNGKKSKIPAKPAFKRACDQNVYEALLLANQMIELADKGDLDREDVGCGILYGILRDSGYKLKKAAEKEKKSHMRKGFWRERTVDPSLQTNHYAIKKEKGGKMAEKLQVFKCEVCGNIVEVVHGGQGELVCCGQAMQLMTENTVDAAKEKHVPAIEKIEGGFKVKVGEVAHPMQEKHYIEWIEIIADGKAYRQFLNPGDAPEAVFMIDAKDVAARELCNIHGLWKA